MVQFVLGFLLKHHAGSCQTCRSGLTKLKEKQQTREAMLARWPTFSPTKKHGLWFWIGRGSSEEGGSICQVGRPAFFFVLSVLICIIISTSKTTSFVDCFFSAIHKSHLDEKNEAVAYHLWAGKGWDQLGDEDDPESDDEAGTAFTEWEWNNKTSKPKSLPEINQLAQIIHQTKMGDGWNTIADLFSLGASLPIFKG